jgi:hypothetical protein
MDWVSSFALTGSEQSCKGNLRILGGLEKRWKDGWASEVLRTPMESRGPHGRFDLLDLLCDRM